MGISEPTGTGDFMTQGDGRPSGFRGGKIPDFSGDEREAQVLASRINAFWLKRGRFAEARVILLPGSRDGARLYSITSNMVNGVPPRKEGHSSPVALYPTEAE